MYKWLAPWAMRSQNRRSAFRYSPELDLVAATAYRLGEVESDCVWCKDRWGFSWQITPQRAFEAMITMKKIDIAALDTAVGDLLE